MKLTGGHLMAKTMQERFAAALEGRGERIVKRTFRYIVYSRNHGGGFYYLGRSGALRIGRTIADSVPARGEFKAALLQEVQ